MARSAPARTPYADRRRAVRRGAARADPGPQGARPVRPREAARPVAGERRPDRTGGPAGDLVVPGAVVTGNGPAARARSAPADYEGCRQIPAETGNRRPPGRRAARRTAARGPGRAVRGTPYRQPGRGFRAAFALG